MLGAASTPHTLCSVAHTTTHISHHTLHITQHSTACRPRCVWGWRARAVCPPPAPTKASPASRGPAQPSPAQHHTAVRLSHQYYAHTATSQHMTTRDGVIWQYQSSTDFLVTWSSLTRSQQICPPPLTFCPLNVECLRCLKSGMSQKLSVCRGRFLIGWQITMTETVCGVIFQFMQILT